MGEPRPEIRKDPLSLEIHMHERADLLSHQGMDEGKRARILSLREPSRKGREQRKLLLYA